MTAKEVIKREDVVIKFVGDSGDGMQLTGTLFSDTSALDGNDIATFPDYPAEIRAPHNTVAGVSGFQVHIGKKIYSSGDKADVLVAMNPASLKANLKWAKVGGIIIVDADTFEEIKAHEDSITQHAEVESLEVIFSKELTDFIEEKRKEWHETGSNDILEEVGKRVTKELLENTKDETGMIGSMEERV